MQPEVRDPHDRLLSRTFSRPSSKLGWIAAAAMAFAIALVFFVNATATQGGAAGPESHGILFIVMLVCLYASWVTGLVAMFRKRERSWVVLFPTVLISAVVVNELVQGLVLLVGSGE
jgi:hypothetical protein